MKKISFVIVFIAIISLFIGYKFIFHNKSDVKSNSKIDAQLEKLGIDKSEYKNINKTLEVAIFDSNFDINNVKTYNKINYTNIDNFINIINTMISNNISTDDINYVVDNFIKYSNFNVNNASRYINYKKDNPSLDNANIVTYVNIKLDKEFYKDATLIDNPDDLFVIVNKFNYLDENFIPKNLVSLSNNSSAKMVDVAANAYEEFIKEAKNNGYSFQATTAYRSYSWQNQLYTNYVNKDGVTAADRYSARPGFSEHQTGLAVDLKDTKLTDKRLSDDDYEWIKNNSYKFGFILRYPHDSEKITGYMEETWHLRYLGKDVAKKVFDSKLTYDEYYDLYIKK